MRKIGVLCKPKAPSGVATLNKLIPWLQKQNYQVFMDKETAALINETSSHGKEEISQQADLLIVLGGDGTLLGVARSAHPYDVPILAVNLGSLGFLAEISLNQLYPVLENVLSGKFDVERRMLLNACIWRNGKKVEDHNVLNDVVINKGVVARVINLQVLVNGQYMTSYRADGLIIATPTGSTAYSLSAGGPIVNLNVNGYIITPVSPVSLSSRSIVINDSSSIYIDCEHHLNEITIFADGQESDVLLNDAKIHILKSKILAKIIKTPFDIPYFARLRTQLGWNK